MTNQILEAYSEIMKRRQDYGVFHKCLFHIHTPASYDYCLRDGEDVDYYFNLSIDDIFMIAVDEGLLLPELFASHDDLPLDDLFTDKKEYIAYLLIAHKLYVDEIEIAVVSDHNNINGFRKLKRAIELYCTGKSNAIYTHLFLGVELSCADKNHIVGIFDTTKNGIEESIKNWLSENIMSDIDGTFRTSYDILSEISNKPLNGIGYIAHIDTSDTFKKGFLNQAYRKKLFSNRHIAIGLSDIDKRTDIALRIKDFNREQTAYLWDCDAHSIDALGSKAFWIKGQAINFNMLKNALRDYEIAIQYGEPQEPKQFILGIVVNSGTENFLTANPSQTQETPFKVQFSDSLNCFIGGRGTGKSTVLNILNFILGQYLPAEKERGKSILEFVCRHQSIYIFYRFDGVDYAIAFSAPHREYSDDDIIKGFTEATPFNQGYKYSYSYDRDKIADYAMKHCIEIIRIDTVLQELKAEQISDKRTLLKKFYSTGTTGFSVNDLVNIAGSESLGKYIYTILFQNKSLSNSPVRNIRSQKGLLIWSGEMENHLSTRAQEVHSIIDSYNRTQIDKLKITYSQDNYGDADIAFSDLFRRTRTHWYKGYSISVENIIEYLHAVSLRIGLAKMTNLFLTKQYLGLNNELSILGFCEELTTQAVENGISEIVEDNYLEFFEKLSKDIFSPSNIEFWIRELKKWVVQTESFGLEFNINNREQRDNSKPIYKRAGELSLGQKVVAMLSFVLSYSEYSKDFTPLIIDQPEDNLDNQYIYKNLVKDLRDMKGKRQIIIATHNSTIVTNAKAEQVIVMDSDNEHGWIRKTGYPTNPAIIKCIIDHLEGGIDSFKHKQFIYDGVLNK